MMNREESGTDLGKIKIHKDVIASITSLAACQVDGVKLIGRDFRSRLREFLDRKDHPAVKVEIDKSGEVSLELPLVIAFGFNIPDVAAKVQENVRAALEKMTGLPVKDININVQRIEKP
jgi:uncharacterized alkaline shock family protein YloU